MKKICQHAETRRKLHTHTHTHTGNRLLSQIFQNLIFSTISILLCANVYADTTDIAANAATSNCTNTITGTYSGTTNFEAKWTPKNITLNWYNGDTQITPSNNAANNCTYDGALTIPSNPPSKTGYVFAGWKVKQCKIPSDLVNSNSGYTDMYEVGKLIYSGIGKVQFDRKCSNTNGTYATPGTPSDTNGRYCWCAATAWIPDGGNQCNISNPVWVFRYADEDFGECETYCNVNVCAGEAQANSNFRSAVFDASD